MGVASAAHCQCMAGRSVGAKRWAHLAAMACQLAAGKARCRGPGARLSRVWASIRSCRHPFALDFVARRQCGLARSPGSKKEGAALALLSLLRFGDAILGVRAHRTFDCSSACAPGANGALISSGVTVGWGASVNASLAFGMHPATMLKGAADGNTGSVEYTAHRCAGAIHGPHLKKGHASHVVRSAEQVLVQGGSKMGGGRAQPAAGSELARGTKLSARD